MFSGLSLLNTFDSKEGKGSFVLGKITVLKPVPAMTQTAGFPDSVNGVPLHRQLDPLPCTLCTLAHLDTYTLCAVHTCKLFTLAHCTVHTCSLAHLHRSQPINGITAGPLSWQLELCPGCWSSVLELPSSGCNYPGPATRLLDKRALLVGACR